MYIYRYTFSLPYFLPPTFYTVRIPKWLTQLLCFVRAASGKETKIKFVQYMHIYTVHVYMHIFTANYNFAHVEKILPYTSPTPRTIGYYSKLVLFSLHKLLREEKLHQVEQFFKRNYKAGSFTFFYSKVTPAFFFHPSLLPGATKANNTE